MRTLRAYGLVSEASSFIALAEGCEIVGEYSMPACRIARSARPDARVERPVACAC